MSDEERWEKEGAPLFRQARAEEVEPHPAVLARVKGGVRERLEKPSGSPLPRLMLAAAVALALVGAAVMVRGSAAPGSVLVEGQLSSAAGVVPPGARLDAATELFTTDAQAVLALAQNARVELAAATRVRVPSVTELALTSGKVKLQVTHGPFRVSARDVSLEVVGTAFEVASDGTQVLLHVSEGTVRVSRGADRWDVKAGESWPAPRAEAPPAHAAPKAEELSQLEKAAVFTQQGKLDAARAIYAELAKQDAPVAELALYHLAHLEAQRAHRPKVALEVLDELLRRFPDGALSHEAKLSRVEAQQALEKRSP
ncbi:MAG: FecR domain-containing protein [Archangiaceae bacterium]|nr:FecR domain-containing protein [Archangiaceae bacterium]